MTTPTVPTHPDGGAATPVHAVSGNSIGGAAIPVYVVSDGRPTLGHPPRRVKVITDADLTINGGNYWIEGRPAAMPVVSVTSGGDEGGAAIPVYVVSGSLNPIPYYQRILATHPANLKRYWPMDDAAGSSIARELVVGDNGTPTNVTFGAAGIGDGKTAATFNGTTSLINIYSAALQADFNGDAGTFMCWIKPNAVARWSDSTSHYFAKFGSAALNDRCWMGRLNDNNFYCRRKAGGAEKLQNTYYQTVNMVRVDWLQYTMTWDVAANEMRLHVAGFQQNVTQTGLGAFADVIANGETKLGDSWAGSMAHAALWNVALTDDEIFALSKPHQLIPSGTGVMPSFYDGMAYELATYMPYAQARGLKATSYVVTSIVDGVDAARLHWADCTALEAMGCVIANHSYTHPEMDAMSQADIQTEYRTAKEALVAHGLTRGALCAGYPNSDTITTSANLQPALVAEGFRSGINTAGANRDTLYPATVNQYNLSSLAATDTLANWKMYASDMMMRGTLVGNSIEVFGDPAAYLTKFQGWCDWLAARSIPTYTIEDWWNFKNA